MLSRQKEYSALVTAAAKKNGKKLSSELEFELQTGKQGGEEEAGKEVVEDATYDDDDVDDIGDDVGDGDGIGDENNGYKVAANEDKEGDQLGLKDLFSKELWLITVVMWIAWPVGKFIHFLFSCCDKDNCDSDNGITFVMATSQLVRLSIIISFHCDSDNGLLRDNLWHGQPQR